MGCVCLLVVVETWLLLAHQWEGLTHGVVDCEGLPVTTVEELLCRAEISNLEDKVAENIQSKQHNDKKKESQNRIVYRTTSRVHQNLHKRSTRRKRERPRN